MFSIVICRNYLKRLSYTSNIHSETAFLSTHSLLNLLISLSSYQRIPENTINLSPLTNHLKTIGKHSTLTSGLFKSQHTDWNANHHMCGNVFLCSSPVARIKWWQLTFLQTTDTIIFIYVISYIQYQHFHVISHSHYMFMTWLSYPEVERGVGTAVQDWVSTFVSQKPLDIFKETFKSLQFVGPK